MTDLNGKVALITGAGQGVGQGVALAMAAAGAKVAVTGRTLEKLEKTVSLIKERGGEAMAIDTIDLSHVPEVLRSTEGALVAQYLVRIINQVGHRTLQNVPNSGESREPFVYFVQAGAFRNRTEADAQRARLSLLGMSARITERDQAGRTIYRVRLGPFSSKADADSARSRVEGNGMEAALVRVQR